MVVVVAELEGSEQQPQAVPELAADADAGGDADEQQVETAGPQAGDTTEQQAGEGSEQPQPSDAELAVPSDADQAAAEPEEDAQPEADVLGPEAAAAEVRGEEMLLCSRFSHWVARCVTTTGAGSRVAWVAFSENFCRPLGRCLSPLSLSKEPVGFHAVCVELWVS